MSVCKSTLFRACKYHEHRACLVVGGGNQHADTSHDTSDTIWGSITLAAHPEQQDAEHPTFEPDTLKAALLAVSLACRGSYKHRFFRPRRFQKQQEHNLIS